jgi:putative ABC transport system substrate-binding protein
MIVDVRIGRRSVLGGLFFSMGGAAWAASTDRRDNVIGVLQTASLTTNASARTIEVLRKSLREEGLVEGQNLKLLLRSAEGDPLTLPTLATELVSHPVHVLFAFGPAAVQAAASATRTLPIVALDLESDPVRAGWARTLSQPGGNVTGLFLNLPELAGKWLELLREMLPRVERVGALWDATTGSAQADAVREAATQLRVSLKVHPLRSAGEMSSALDAARAAGAQALVMLSSPLTRNASRQVAEFSARHGLPAISPFRAFPDAGGLVSYGPDLDYYFARTASFAGKILRGASVGQLPIEQPAKFELIVNAAAARALHVSVPQAVLLRANEVIQ